MAEQIKDGLGSNNYLAVNSDGSLNTNLNSGTNLIGYTSVLPSGNSIFLNSGTIKIFDDSRGPAKLDLSNSLVIIDTNHNRIHEGDHYYIKGFNSVDSGNSVSFGFTTPNTTKRIHMTYEIVGTTQTEAYIYEDSTTSGGSLLIPFNNNRNSENTSDSIVYLNPSASGTGLSSGNLIETYSRGLDGANPSATDRLGNVGRENEIILKSGTTYLYYIKSVGAGNIIDYSLNWYEA